ncbi:flagellar protein FlgN [Metabacillus lacus]|uniref:flagellar protein FlgN n=1 Tax=Metabacillus lacus TaxID=1983721 RepID=UPI0012AFC572
MSAKSLILSLESLLEKHHELYSIGLEKTELLKSNRVKELQQLIQKEQAALSSLQKLEEKRMQETASFLGVSENTTLSACAERAQPSERKTLEKLMESFYDIHEKLRAVNTLNQQLTHQAMQFVTLTMDMLMPQETAAVYTKPAAKTENKRRPLFDSKA